MKKSSKNKGNLKSFVDKHLSTVGKNYMRGEGSFVHTTIVLLVFITLTSGAIFIIAYLVGWMNQKDNLLIKVLGSSLLLALLFTTAWSSARKGKYSMKNRLFNPMLCAGYLFVLSFVAALFFPAIENDYMMMAFGVGTSWFVYGKIMLGMNMVSGYYAPQKVDFTITTEPTIVETNTPEIIVQGDTAKYVFRKRKKLGPLQMPIFMSVYLAVLLLLLIGIISAAIGLIQDSTLNSSGWRALYIGTVMLLGYILSIASWVFNVRDQVKFHSVEETRWQLKQMGLPDEEIKRRIEEFYRAGLFGPMPQFSDN